MAGTKHLHGTRSMYTADKCRCDICVESNSIYMKQWHYNRKLEALQQYGGICACCGESEPSFLSIDHTGNNGTEHRRANNITAGSHTYDWLHNNNYPSGFQVLCMNCNMGKHIGKGICPHQLKA